MGRRLALLLAVSVLLACSEVPVDAPPSPAEPTAAEIVVPPQPEPEPEPEPPAPRAVTVGIGGDILVHLKVWQSAREFEAEGGFRHVFGDLRRVITEDEVAFANLETPLSTRIDPATGDPPVLGAPAAVAEGLAFAGLDAVAVANNHSYDQMSAGLADTVAALSASGVGFAGVLPDVVTDEVVDAVDGEDPPPPLPLPAIVERDGLRVAFLAFTERVNRGPAVTAGQPSARVARWDDDLVARAVRAAREAADVVVVSIHWSHDFRTEPLARQHTRARLMIDAGADLVMGHGPHVLQEVERVPSPRGEAVIAHSLGNLVSNQGLRYFVGRRVPGADEMHPAVVIPQVRDGAWVRVRFELDEGRVRVAALEAIPLWTANNYLVQSRGDALRLDIRARALAHMDLATRLERRPVILAALGAQVTEVEPWLPAADALALPPSAVTP